MSDMWRVPQADFGRLLEPVARKLWGEPNARLSKPTELRWGKKGARIVYVETGAFLDAEAGGESGGTLDLIMRELQCDKAGALAYLEEEKLIEPWKGRASDLRSKSIFYDYIDGDGEIRFRVERRGKGQNPPFLQYAPDGRGGFVSRKGCMAGVELIPYRLPQLLSTVAEGRDAIIYVCEGEKDVDRLGLEGLTATTNPGGAGKWRPGFSDYLRGCRVVVLEDNDEPGRSHAKVVVASLEGNAASAAVLRLPNLAKKQDVSDWLDAGGTAAELSRLAEDAISRVVPAAPRATTQAPIPAEADPDPIDLWARHDPPALPVGLLPQVIEEFARIQSEMIGAEPGGLAMAALTVCAAAIPDSIRVQVKRYDPHWTEAARMWTALIGPPSAKKTPIMSAASRPLCRLDAQLYRNFEARCAAHDALPANERKSSPPPKQVRLRLEDTTIEGAQEVLKDSPDGVLVLQDEMSGWFGSMDKYSGAKGAAKDRGFWLQAFNGGQYTVNRVGRGSSFIENLSVSMLGGIQPEPIRAIVSDAVDDGLIQRLFPIVLRSASVGKDEPMPDVVKTYGQLVEKLNGLTPPPAEPGPLTLPSGDVLRFDDGAQRIRAELEDKHFDLMKTELVNKKLAAHIGKYDGFFAKMCVVWHCIENAHSSKLPRTIDQHVAERVAEFLHKFLLRHAIAFYAEILGLSDDHDRVTDVAGYILTHDAETISRRDLQRSGRSTRDVTPAEAEKIFDQLEAFGWVEKAPSPRVDAPRWRINPDVRRIFAERARAERERRAKIRRTIAELGGGE